MSPTTKSRTDKVRRALAVDGVLLGVTLACAVAFNPAVAGLFDGSLALAPTAPTAPTLTQKLGTPPFFARSPHSGR